MVPLTLPEKVLRPQPVVPFAFLSVGVEAAHEAAPADVLVVEQIADILAGHQHGAGRARAGIVGRIGVADQRQAALAVGDRR